jgi:hypothetical protein
MASLDMVSLDIASLLMVSAAKTLAAPTARHMDNTTVVNFFMMKLLEAQVANARSERCAVKLPGVRQLPPNQL